MRPLDGFGVLCPSAVPLLIIALAKLERFAGSAPGVAVEPEGSPPSIVVPIPSPPSITVCVPVGVPFVAFVRISIVAGEAPIRLGVYATSKNSVIPGSIVDRTSPANVGALMLEHGGGGHEAAGTCQIENERADEVHAELVARLNTRGWAV